MTARPRPRRHLRGLRRPGRFDSAAFDLAVIGAGPAGMAAAATAAEQGLHVALIDAGRQLGGQYFRHPAPGLTADWLPKLYHGWQQFEQLVTRVETAGGGQIRPPGSSSVRPRTPGRAPPTPPPPTPTRIQGPDRPRPDRGPLRHPGHRRLRTRSPLPRLGPPRRLHRRRRPSTPQRQPGPPRPPRGRRGHRPTPAPRSHRPGHRRRQSPRPLRSQHHPRLRQEPPPPPGQPHQTRRRPGLRPPTHPSPHPRPHRTHDHRSPRHHHPRSSDTARPDATDPHRIPCDTLAIGYGLAPQIDLALTLGAAPNHLSDGTIALRVNTTQRTSVPGLYAAGETAGVAGAETALLEGEIAGLAVAQAAARARRAASRAAGTAETQILYRPTTRHQHPLPTRPPPRSPPARSPPPEPAFPADQTTTAPQKPPPPNPTLPPAPSKQPSPPHPQPSPSPASPPATPKSPPPEPASPAAPKFQPPAPPPKPHGHHPSPNISTLLRRRTRQRALADLLRARHPIPAAWREHLADDTVVCRCEEVPAKTIAEATGELGAGDVRTVKLLTRAGMGWCQGRVCGYAVACLAAGGDPASEADLLAAASRPLARPVPLGVLAEQDRRNK